MASLMSQVHGDVRVLYFNETRILDESTLQSIGRELGEFADRCESRKLLLNFDGVKFMSSAMLGKLLELNKKCTAGDIDLKLCGISDDIMQIFKMTKLNKVFDIQANEEKALKAFAKKGFFS